MSGLSFSAAAPRRAGQVQTLCVTIEWSYDLLTPVEKRLSARTQCARRQLESGGGGSGPPFPRGRPGRRGRAALADRESIVARQPVDGGRTRFSMLQTIRDPPSPSCRRAASGLPHVGRQQHFLRSSGEWTRAGSTGTFRRESRRRLALPTDPPEPPRGAVVVLQEGDLEARMGTGGPARYGRGRRPGLTVEGRHGPSAPVPDGTRRTRIRVWARQKLLLRLGAVEQFMATSVKPRSFPPRRRVATLRTSCGSAGRAPGIHRRHPAPARLQRNSIGGGA